MKTNIGLSLSVLSKWAAISYKRSNKQSSFETLWYLRAMLRGNNFYMHSRCNFKSGDHFVIYMRKVTYAWYGVFIPRCAHTVYILIQPDLVNNITTMHGIKYARGFIVFCFVIIHIESMRLIHLHSSGLLSWYWTNRLITQVPAKNVNPNDINIIDSYQNIKTQKMTNGVYILGYLL